MAVAQSFSTISMLFSEPKPESNVPSGSPRLELEASGLAV